MQSFSPLQPVLARYNMKQVLAGPTPALLSSYCEQSETFEVVDVEWPVEKIEMLENIGIREEIDIPVLVWDESSVTAMARENTRIVPKLRREWGQ